MPKFGLVLIFLMLSNPALAVDYIGKYVPNPNKVGEGRLTVFMWDVYDAELYASDGAFSQDKPFAIHIKYLRDIEGTKIADRSAEEMRDQGLNDEIKIAGWHTQMRNIFPDVAEGTTLTGIYKQDGTTIFYHNGKNVGTIRDPLFGSAFFNIWLSEKTSAPDLRRKLLGLASR